MADEPDFAKVCYVKSLPDMINYLAYTPSDKNNLPMILKNLVKTKVREMANNSECGFAKCIEEVQCPYGGFLYQGSFLYKVFHPKDHDLMAVLCFRGPCMLFPADYECKEDGHYLAFSEELGIIRDPYRQY